MNAAILDLLSEKQLDCILEKGFAFVWINNRLRKITKEETVLVQSQVKSVVKNVKNVNPYRRVKNAARK